ncbi:hypothetical protein POSPLADRAFT_1034352 [Postia placenta MAD-698-R-SB12]|uniref:Uncharacterized protein n=1 Tax=Postia placenta MAD-698-R-SB12 TaxID=670580 RepID=A0A1X6N090_9APHY|nr:hypothetical protein POSPLADRAFT_1034352 [Postia placenta MAD-698-R-SB12]OSX61853.1 hypothetical protein POSPLADRAFT_1034352 [Postia placenta MAD-698-R-SB12]
MSGRAAVECRMLTAHMLYRMSSTAPGTVTTPPPSVASNFTATFTITDGVTTRQATYNGNLSASTQRFDSEPNGATLTYSKVPSGNCSHEGTVGAGNINLTLTDPDGIKYVVAGKLKDGPSTSKSVSGSGTWLLSL